MKYALGLIAAGALTLALQVDRPAAQISGQAAAPEPLTLSEQDKAAVIKAALEAKSHQKTPKEFTPAVGAAVPKAIYVHGFKPDVAHTVPALKRYWYAHLDQQIVLIDALQTKVAMVIPLPEKFASDGQQQPHHGAAESDGESKVEDGTSSTESVPAYTSPKTIK